MKSYQEQGGGRGIRQRKQCTVRALIDGARSVEEKV